MSASEIYFPYGKENMPWNSDKYVLTDQFQPHKKDQNNTFRSFSYPISLHTEISPDNASKTWRFPFPNQNGLRTKEAACRIE